MCRKKLDGEALRQTEILNFVEAEHRQNIERQIQIAEREGDHRQARIWRRELIGLRQRIAHVRF